MPPPPRDRYHSGFGEARHAAAPQRYAKKDETRYAGKKTSRPELATASPAAVANARDEVLREALAKALTNPNAGAGTSSSLGEVDSYGKGSPTDRLQFGYSPAIAAEAAAFHARFTTEGWVAARKLNGRLAFVKKQKLSPLNCEPVTSILKLQRHWKKINVFQSDVRGGNTKLKAADLDQLLDMLASKQRIGEAE